MARADTGGTDDALRELGVDPETACSRGDLPDVFE